MAMRTLQQELCNNFPLRSSPPWPRQFPRVLVKWWSSGGQVVVKWRRTLNFIHGYTFQTNAIKCRGIRPKIVGKGRM